MSTTSRDKQKKLILAGSCMGIVAAISFWSTHRHTASTAVNSGVATTPQDFNATKDLNLGLGQVSSAHLDRSPSSTQALGPESTKTTVGIISPTHELGTQTTPGVSLSIPNKGTGAVLGVTPVAPGTANGVTPPTAKPAEPEQSCYSLTLNHKSMPGHSDMDSCSMHRNLIRIKHAQVNLKTLCVRVDGTPVAFQVKEQTKENIALTIGPIAGPTSKITARYCVGKEACPEECKIPKDEFMAAIGGDDEGTGAVKAPTGKMAKWDANDQESDSDVSGELEADIQKELAEKTELALFEGWNPMTETTACPVKTGEKTLISKRN